MAGSLGLSGNKSKDMSEFDQNVWGPQGQALQQMFGQIGNLFGITLPGMQEQVQGATGYASDVADSAKAGWQDQMQGGAYKDMGLQDSLMSSLAQSQNSPSAMSEINAMMMGGSGNNYADAMRNQYTQDATSAMENMLANTDARAAASGMSGGSRHGIVQAKGMEDINKNLQGNLARVGYETFDKDLDRKLDIARQADMGTLARQNLMSSMIGQQQGAMSDAVAGSGGVQNLGMGVFDPYMAPWNAANAYSSTIGDPTVLGSGSSYAKSKGGGANASMGKG